MGFLDDILGQLPLMAATPLTAEERNIALIPDGMPVVKHGALNHPDAGPPGGEGPPQRVVAVLGPGATFAGIADSLMPRYQTAASIGGPAAPTPDELARAIVVYAKGLLTPPSWSQHMVGLILPLPIEIDPAGPWIVDADRIRTLAGSFDAGWRPRLRTPPAAIPVPDALFLEAQAADLAMPAAASPLWTRVLRNPSEAVLLFLAWLRALDRAGPGPAATAALTALNAATPAQLSVLAATRGGNGILRRLAALLAKPPAGADPALVAGRQALLDNALHQGAAGARTLVPHRDVPQTLAQQAARRGAAKAVAGAAADPPGGLHQLVFGRDVAVGPPAPARVSGTLYTGPAFGGRLALAPYLEADKDHVNIMKDPRMPALVTLLANAADRGQVHRLDSVQAHDAGLVTVGLDQWSATADAGLPALLSTYKTSAPDEFDLFFALHGLDVQPGPPGGPAHQLLVIGPDGTGTVPTADALRAFFGGTADAHGTITFDPAWAARFRLAALMSAAYRRVQVAQAAARIASTADPVTILAATLGPFPATAYELTFDTTVPNKLQGFVGAGMLTVITNAIANSAQDAGTLAAAVVDLAGGPGVPPPFAGFQPDECYYVGSLGKIGAMYAAFELRLRVQRLMFAARIANSTVTPRAVFHVIGDVWGPQICRTFPDFPALDVRYPGRFSQLDTMFTVAANGTVSFRQGAATDDDIKAVEDGPLTQTMTFADWMKSMIFWSNNHAAGRVIDAIGYPYVNWLLRRAGFFHPDTKLGLWLSQNYVDAGWKPNADLMTLTPRGKTHYKATSNITGTCREIARLLTLAALHKLFEGTDAAAACDEMILLMRKLNTGAAEGPRGIGDRSPIGEALGLAGTDTVDSKIDLGDPPNPPNPPAPPNVKSLGDCAIVARTVGGKTFRYVAVVLGGYNDGGVNGVAFDDTARALDASIQHP
jgi:hypothetical protein